MDTATSANTQTSHHPSEEKSTLKHTAQAVSDKAAHVRDGVQDNASAQIERARDLTVSGADASADFVRKNPGLAMAGAVGFGVLLGLALRNRY